MKASRSGASSIAVVDASTANWVAGGAVSRTMLHAMIAAGGAKERSLLFVTRDVGAASAFDRSGVEVVHFGAASTGALAGLRASRSDADRRVRRALGLPDAADPLAQVRHRNPEVVLPLLSVPPRPRLRGVVGWLPDFQHRTLPMHFSDGERSKRDRSYVAVCRRAKVVMLSSHAMAAEFNEYYPQWRSKVRVLSFPSSLTFVDLDADPGAVVDRYGLPPKFALVANQFWQHKNHSIVVDALDRLKRAGSEIPLVMTGLPADYRDPSNGTVSRLLQQVARCRLAGQVIVLGQVPYADLVSLMRTAAVVVQPSLYEGWNTSIEDAKALGRPLVCSDIAVHREQVTGDAGAFFDPKNPEALASQLANSWASSQAWSLRNEQTALAGAYEAGVIYGRSVLDICDEVSPDA